MTDRVLSPLHREDIRARVQRFAGGRLRDGVVGQRERSYDHCYNYFAVTRKPTADLEKSCAVLCFYLASWGMYRGSSYLFKSTNSSHFIPVVKYVEQFGDTLRGIDADRYDGANIASLITAYSTIRDTVLPEGNTAITLITKILAGVFGCVPAYDTYFRLGIRKVTRDHSPETFWRFSPRSLELLADFYQSNRSAVDELAAESRTWRFSDDAAASGVALTKAKILDMYFFDLGYRREPPATDSAR